MNQKTAKGLRRAVRAAFHKDPAEVELDRRFRRNLTPIKGLFVFEQRVMHKHCGRAIYQRLKKAIRTGVLVPDQIAVPRAVRHADLAMEHAGA
ncbi:MAG TPA: hypothetical protein VF534_01650 [Paraburkholderia sp.]